MFLSKVDVRPPCGKCQNLTFQSEGNIFAQVHRKSDHTANNITMA